MFDFLKSERFREIGHNALRIAAGAAFFTHGGQKLFAWFGRDEPVAYLSEYGIAGFLEFFGGLAMILGALTQPIAFLLSGEMAVAYFWQHAAGGESFSLWWWANRGELPLLYCFIWLFFAGHGAGSFSVDAWLAKRRTTVTSPAAAGRPAHL
jgi:putative oxidoreductase